MEEGALGPSGNPRANTTIVFPPGASKELLAAKLGVLRVRRWWAWEEPSFTLSIHRGKVDGAGWHFPLTLGE